MNKSGKTVGDLLVAGKPVLITAGSVSGAEMIVKEAAWKIGLEPRSMDMEFATPDSVHADLASMNPGDLVLVTEAGRADQETQEALAQAMHRADVIVAVADREPPSYLPPDKFAHWGKF